MTYQGTIFTLLFCALFINFYQWRAVILTFLAGFFLVIIPQLLPDQDLLQERWFYVLITLEVIFMFLTGLLWKCPAAKAIICFNIWNIIGHWIGLRSFETDNELLYGLYGPIIQAGEFAQVLALWLLSRPITNLFIVGLGHRRDNKNGQFRVAAYTS